MSNHISEHKIFLNIAKEISKLSNCVSTKVGCIIVKDGRILSTGYNGSPAGYYNCDSINKKKGKSHTKWSDKHEIHAEMNAILFAAKNGIAIDKATLYSTIQPCWQCTKNIINAGIKYIIYDKDYYRLTENDQIELTTFLKDNNIISFKYKRKNN